MAEKKGYKRFGFLHARLSKTGNCAEPETFTRANIALFIVSADLYIQSTKANEPSIRST
jgi:hypothetical protein